MNNYAYGTIAGLQKAHYGTTVGCVFRDGRRAVLARLRGHRARPTAPTACGSSRPSEFKPALEQAVASDKPFVHRRRRC